MIELHFPIAVGCKESRTMKLVKESIEKVDKLRQYKKDKICLSYAVHHGYYIYY